MRGTLPKGLHGAVKKARKEKRKGGAWRRIIIGIKEGCEEIEETRKIEGLVGRKVKINGKIWNIYMVCSNKIMGKLKRKWRRIWNRKKKRS